MKIASVNDAVILVFEEVTQEMKASLDRRIVEYCCGRVQAAEDPDHHSLDTTVHESFKLYDIKGETTQLGIAGELIAQTLSCLAMELANINDILLFEVSGTIGAHA